MMSKKFAALVSLVVAGMLAVFCLTGCDDGGGGGGGGGETSTTPMNCVVLYSQRSNSCASAGDLDEYLQNVASVATKDNGYKSGYFNVVSLDGEPTEFYKANDERNQFSTNHNKSRREKNDKQTIAQIEEDMKSMTAIKSELDFAAALQKGNKCLGKADDDTAENVLIIVGPALSTLGTINFTVVDDFSQEGLKNYLAYLIKNEELKELKNVDKIVWIGFDAITDPQTETSAKTWALLQTFYEDLFSELGVDDVEFVDGDTQEPGEDLPKVTTLALPKKAKYKTGDEISLSAENILGFKIDSTDFKDDFDPKSNAVLNEIAESLKNDSSLKLTVTGYIAHYPAGAEGKSVSEQDPDNISGGRAEAIKSVLAELVGSDKQITTKAGGFGPYASDEENRCVTFTFK